MPRNDPYPTRTPPVPEVQVPKPHPDLYLCTPAVGGYRYRSEDGPPNSTPPPGLTGVRVNDTDEATP